MTFHRLFARRDDRFKTKRFASRVLSRVRFSHRELSDVPSQEVEADMTLVFPERVRDGRLAGLDFESHRVQPRVQKTFGFLHSCFGWMKNDQIIGVPNELRDTFFV